MENVGLAAVALNNQGKVVMWTCSEPDCVTTLDSSELLDGVKTLLEFALAEQWKSIEIHLSALYTYNILTRYKEKWKQQCWHTSRNKPIPLRIKTVLLEIDRLAAQFPEKGVFFKNVSSGFCDKDMALRQLSTINIIQ